MKIAIKLIWLSTPCLWPFGGVAQEKKVLVYSEHSFQYISSGWRSVSNKHNLESSMSSKGDCPDKTVAKSFFYCLERTELG